MENGNAPATKQDIVDAVGTSEKRLRTEVRETIHASEDRLRTEMRETIHASEERLIEKMRDMQTELLNVFYGLIESNRQRLVETESETVHLKNRLSTIEDRLLVLERKVLTPKPPEA